MPDALDISLYEIGIDVAGFSRDAQKISDELGEIGEDAKKTFDRDFGARLAKSLDPKNFEADVKRARTLLGGIGPDAAKSFERAMGREASKNLYAPFLNQTKTLSGQVKAALSDAFNIKKIAAGTITGFLAADLIQGAVRGIVNVGKETVNLARDAEETRSKFNVLFGDMAEQTRGWANTFADSVGRSRVETEDFLATIKSFLGPLGISSKAADDMSKAITSLAVDVASFNNALDADVLRDFRSALSGESEPVKKYGIIITEARVKQEAWRRGIAEVGAELTEQQKVLTRYQILLSDTTTAQGDAIRTSDSLANQQKRLDANLKNIGETIGRVFVPAMADAISGLNDFLASFAQTELEERIATLRELGASAELITFLTLRSNAEKAQKTLKDLEVEFSNLSADISVFGATTNKDFFGQKVFQARAAKEIFSQVKDTINTAEGLVAAGKLLEELKARAATLEQTLLLAEQGRLTLSRQDVLVTTQQSEAIKAQIATLENVLTLSTQIVATKKAIEKSEKNIAESNRKTSDDAAAAAKVAADAAIKQTAEQERLSKLSVERLREELKTNKENASFIQELIKNKEEEIKLSERAFEFVKKTRTELQLLSASSELERALIGIQQEADARRQEFAGRADAIAEVSAFEIAKIQEIADKRREALEGLKQDLLELTVEDTTESRLQAIQQEHQERIKTLENERAAVERNVTENKELRKQLLDTIAQQIATEQQLQTAKEQKIRDEIAKTNADLAKRLEIASARSSVEASLITIRQNADEQKKLLNTVGKERENQEKQINALARKEFKKTIAQFEDGLDELEKRKLKELLLKLKITLEGEFNFDEIIKALQKGLDESLTPSIGEKFQKRLKAIGQPFTEFEDFLGEFGIKLDSEFFDLIGIFDKGAAQFIENIVNFASSFKDGPVSIISASIPLIDGLIGGLFGDREKKRKEALEEQERISEGARLALERFNKEIDETRKAAEKATIGFLADEYEKISERIREITGLNRELTKEEFDRYRLLRIREQGLLEDIERARDAGDLEWLLALEAELVTVQDELELIGGDLSHLTLSQLEALRELIEKQEIYNKALEEFGKFAPGFAGIMEKLNRQFELFDINDPAQKLELFNKAIFEAFGVTLPNSVEDIEVFVRGLFDAFLEGGEVLSQFLQQNNLAGLSDLTAEEFLNLLTTIEGFADDLGGVADSLSDPFQRIKDELSLLFDIADIEDPARQLGILRTQLNRQFESLIPSDIPGLEDFIQNGLRAFIAGGEQLENFLAGFGLEELTRDQFEQILRDFEGLLDAMVETSSEAFDDMVSDLNLAFDLLNIDDPAKQFEKFSKEVKKRFGAIIPQTTEQLELLISQGAAALIEGGDALKAFMASVNLEELSEEQFEAFLRQVRDFADDLKARGESVADTEQDIKFSSVKAVTFAQGNKLIDEIVTMRIAITQILAELRDTSRVDEFFRAPDIASFANFEQLMRLREQQAQIPAQPQEPRNVFVLVNGDSARVISESELNNMNKRLFEKGKAAATALGIV